MLVRVCMRSRIFPVFRSPCQSRHAVAGGSNRCRGISSSHIQSSHQLLIDGRLVDAESGATFPVINPADDTAFAHVPDACKSDATRAIVAADEAYKTWSRMAFSERASCLLAFSDALEKRVDEFGEAVTLEQGKPLAQGRSEVFRVVELCRHIAKIGNIPNERVAGNDDIELQYRSRGVVAGVQPWNFPLAMAGKQMAPALATGNTVVLKPSEHTPLSTVMLGSIAKDTFPPGVVNILSGSREGSRSIGQELFSHPLVKHVVFVGSIPTGQFIMRESSSTLKKITFELGGNDPAIVLPGSNISEIALEIFDVWMFNSGQVCTTIKRLYVHDSQYDEMVERLAYLANMAKDSMGNGLHENTRYGPLNNLGQLALVDGLVKDAHERGGKIVTGGQRSAPSGVENGYFYEPTVISDITDDARLVVEEQFGPVLPVLKYTDVDDALRRANNSDFGLGGSVWGPDAKEASKVLAQLDVGIAWLNCHNAGNICTPYGAVKLSGVGVGGDAVINSLKEYTDMRTVWVPK